MGKSTSLVEFQNVVIVKVTKGWEFASLGSVKWLKSMVLVNGHSHFGQSHPGENIDSSAFQGHVLLTKFPSKLSFLKAMMTSAGSKQVSKLTNKIDTEYKHHIWLQNIYKHSKGSKSYHRSRTLKGS